MVTRKRYAGGGARQGDTEDRLPAGGPREFWGAKRQRGAYLSALVWEALDELATMTKQSTNALMDEALQEFLKKQSATRDLKALKKVQTL